VLPEVVATRYVVPLREGGSLPGLMEAADLGTYVVKFRGAGQGPGALVAEVVSGQLARSLGLPVPELVTVLVDPGLAAGEPDQEVQDLLRASGGRNLGIDYLPGAFDLDPVAFAVDAGFAGRVLWFDALVGNVDRSWRNPNLLRWHGAPYLIDHGATLTFQHNWPTADRWPGRPYDARDHVLLGCRPDVAGADATLGPLVTADLVDAALADVPPDWLATGPAAYADRLLARVAARGSWVPALVEAAAAGAGERAPARSSRPRWLDDGGAP
jgi:HipA-like kinase